MKKYKRRIMVGGTMFEAMSFYVPYFKLNKGILKCVRESVPKKHQWLKDLCNKTNVYYDITENYKEGVYYTLKDRSNNEQFYLDLSKGVILNEY